MTSARLRAVPVTGTAQARRVLQHGGSVVRSLPALLAGGSPCGAVPIARRLVTSSAELGVSASARGSRSASRPPQDQPGRRHHHGEKTKKPHAVVASPMGEPKLNVANQNDPCGSGRWCV